MEGLYYFTDLTKYTSKSQYPTGLSLVQCSWFLDNDQDPIHLAF
jgi:hypothetical protein